VTIKPVRVSGQALGIKNANSGLPLLVLKVDVRPGNSVGPVLDARGNLIGIMFGQINTPQVYKKTGVLLRHVGFAVPSQLIIPFLERAGIRIKPKAIDDVGDKPDSRKTPFIAQVGCWR
jgi:S1-C subfamily serine protease